LSEERFSLVISTTLTAGLNDPEAMLLNREVEPKYFSREYVSNGMRMTV